MLCRVRVHGPCRGFGVHLRLYDARRALAWIIGWDLVLEYAVGSGDGRQRLVALFSRFSKVFGLEWPRTWGTAPFDYDPAIGEFARTGSVLDLPAMIIAAIITIVLIVGIRETPVSML